MVYQALFSALLSKSWSGIENAEDAVAVYFYHYAFDVCWCRGHLSVLLYDGDGFGGSQ